MNYCTHQLCYRHTSFLGFKMLPDFLEVKRKILEGQRGALQQGATAHPLLGKIRRYTIHEGDSYTLVRDDGSEETRTPHREEAVVEITADEIQTRGSEVVREKLGSLQAQLVNGGKNLLLTRLSEAAKQVGNVFEAKGSPFTAEMYLDLVEKTEASFDEDGVWQKPMLYPDPPSKEMFERIESEMRRFEDEPVLRERLNILLEHKRNEWRDRESHRKLVD